VTIIEVIVAATVLLIGVLGVATMVEGANSASTAGKAREQGANLAREVLEFGRSIPYAQLLPTAVVAKLQAKPGLANANAGPGWTIQRRGVTYTLAVGVCAVDDPSDGYGTEDPNLFCAAGAKATPSPACAQLMGRSGSVTGDSAAVKQNSSTLSGQQAIGLCGLDPDLDGRVDYLTQSDASQCAGGACQNTPSSNDLTPDDYKRLVVLVTWSSQPASGYVLQSTLITNPGQASGPPINSFGLGGSLTSPITDSTLTSIPFTLTADSQATSVQWSLNGVAQASATSSSGSWTFSWSVGSTGSGSEVLDGNYTVGVVAFDSNGNAGPPRSMTITLNRRAPYAPPNFGGGRNGSVVDLQWSPNKEGDVLGYRVYRIAGSGQPDVLVCSTGNAQSVSCQDTNPPNVSSIQYYVVALDKDANANTREGDHSTTLTVGTTNKAPNAATGLQASTQNGNTVLLWTAPNPADADGDVISFYRIYRDGQAVSNRYDTAPANVSTYTDTATGGVAHTYYVTVVDPQLAESSAAGPVTR
jgi:hypothetical protein